MSHLIATLFYVGHMRPAPGTWGSLAGVLTAFIIASIAGPYGLIIMCLAVFALGYWATAQETAGKQDHDPSEIVIDEVVGQWIAILPVVFGAANNDVALMALWPGWVAAFVLFRFFDITKLSLVGWADRQHGPLGVMLDDVIAGVFAAIGVGILAGVYHLVLT
jgi:phosphatidylglycerophosphatase A